MKITIEVCKGRLVLRWKDGSKRHNLFTGVYDNLIAWMLEKHLDKPAHLNLIGRRDADAFALTAAKALSGRTIKERIWLLCSAWNLARDKYSVDKINPWEGISNRRYL